jgi:hypothetical protein
MPDDQAQHALVTLAQRYRGKPNVMYALQVEPHDVTWEQVQPRYVQMVDAIQAVSSPYKPIILVPGVNWSRDVSGAITHPVPRENVVYKSHPYNNQSQFQHEFLDAYDAGLPVFIGEFGYELNAPMYMSDVNALLSVTRQRHIGWTAWILDAGTGSTALVTNNTTFEPTAPYGVAVQNEMLTTPPLPTDEPSIASMNDSAFTYSGTWQAGSGRAKFLGDDHYSDIANNFYQVPFTGTQIKLYAATAPWHGQAVVSIDAGPEATVDFYSPSRVDQALVYASPVLAPSPHTLTVRVTGTKNASATGTVVTADRADIIPSALTINDDAIGTALNQIEYTGTWSYATGNPAKYQGDDHYSNSTGSSSRIRVSGTSIVLYGSKAPWHGVASVVIDGGLATPVDYYAPTRQDGVAVYTSPPLAAGVHTLTLTVAGTKNAAATDTLVTLDRVEVSR